MKPRPIDLPAVQRIAEEYARQTLARLKRDLGDPEVLIIELVEREITTAYGAGYIHGRTTR